VLAVIEALLTTTSSRKVLIDCGVTAVLVELLASFKSLPVTVLQGVVAAIGRVILVVGVFAQRPLTKGLDNRNHGCWRRDMAR
jgi:hypothetical protein